MLYIKYTKYNIYYIRYNDRITNIYHYICVYMHVDQPFRLPGNPCHQH